MPWTRKQVRYLLSSASPLTAAQKAKDKAELHANPAMGHMKKGSSSMAKLSAPAAARVRAVAAPLLKVPATTSKPLSIPKNKPGRAPNGRATAENTKSGYGK